MIRTVFSGVVLLNFGLLAAVSAVAQQSPAAEAPKPSAAAATSPPAATSRAAWMPRGTFGVMTHYLIQPKGNTPAERTADLNRTVDRFDLDGYIRQIEATRADWLIFTLGQCTGYLCSPNAYLEAKAPGHSSRRDLVLEIAKRLKPLGKRLILYIPSQQNADPAIQEALHYGAEGQEDRYFALLREYSLRFGTLHHGWWFDSCGPHPDDYWKKYLAAVRAGNPEAAVAFSGAEFCCGGPINPVCKLADYHAGEIHLLEDGKIRRDFLPPGGDIVVTPERKLRQRGQEARYYLPDGPTIDGIQWHGLLPIDLTFNPAIPNQFCHYTDKELLAFVRRVKAVGGALSINVPIDVETGLIPEDSHSQLVRLGKTLSGK
jgi:hypothetical protein